jgi:hypothetical protein
VRCGGDGALFWNLPQYWGEYLILHLHCSSESFTVARNSAALSVQRLKNRLVFLKITKNRWNRIGTNLKIAEFTVHCFKILEKDKNQQNIYIKLIEF